MKQFVFSRRIDKGQMVLETAFVFASLTFLIFAIINFAIIFHTKNVATYAAFMAARSYEVMGDLDRGFEDENDKRSIDIYEVTEAGKKPSSFMDNAKVPTPYQVAEDIYTCALPWV